VILTDAGPLVALLDADESAHERCWEALEALTLPMVTSCPAFTEAMHLLGRAAGWRAQEALWRLVSRGDLVTADLDKPAMTRAAALMQRYADRPMDLADATLVALAEQRDFRQIFTLDRDFHVYRLRSRRHLRVIPG
jgi:predicted nucleic acid-binding protein